MKTLFLSDLHLGAGCISDPKAHEKAVCAFLREEGADAGSIYLLGDVLDYWYEYRYVVPRGFVRFFGSLASLADSGVKITWMTGNHDIWLFDYLRDELGVEVIDSPYIVRTIGGKKFVLAHGDRLGSEDASFRTISKIFRNHFCQRLYSSLHPRWTVPFAKKWSSTSRNSHHSAPPESKIANDAQRIAVLNPGTDYIVMGHHHIVVDSLLPDTGTRLIVLGDWLNHFTYGIFDSGDFVIRTYNDISEKKIVNLHRKPVYRNQKKIT